MNYASKSGWSSIKEMNSPCNLISYGSLLCWAAESNCPWKEIYLQYVLAVWDGIAIWSANTATPPPLPTHHPPTTPTPGLVHKHLETFKKPCLWAAKTTQTLPLAKRCLDVETSSVSPNQQGVCGRQALVKARRLAMFYLSEKKTLIGAQKLKFTASHCGVTSH